MDHGDIESYSFFRYNDDLIYKYNGRINTMLLSECGLTIDEPLTVSSEYKLYAYRNVIDNTYYYRITKNDIKSDEFNKQAYEILSAKEIINEFKRKWSNLNGTISISGSFSGGMGPIAYSVGIGYAIDSSGTIVKQRIYSVGLSKSSIKNSLAVKIERSTAPDVLKLEDKGILPGSFSFGRSATTGFVGSGADITIFTDADNSEQVYVATSVSYVVGTPGTDIHLTGNNSQNIEMWNIFDAANDYYNNKWQDLLGI